MSLHDTDGGGTVVVDPDSEPVRRRLIRALRDHRTSLGLSQEALAHRLGYDRRTVMRIEQGDAGPSEKYMAAWFRTFNDDPERATVVSLYDELRATETAAGSMALSTSDPSLRQFDLGQLDQLRRGLDAAIGRGAISAAALDVWEQLVLRHGQATRDRPAMVLLVDVATDLAELQRILARCRSASTLRRATRVMAQMSGLMVLAMVKLDQRLAFRSWARTARIAAEEAGDPVTSSWVLAQEAYGHYYSGDLLEAIDVARHAQAVTNLPCVGAALAAALEARAHAALGRDPETRTALTHAEALLSRLEAGSMIASAFGYTESQLRFHQGNAFTHLHDTKSAWTAQDRALALCPPWDYMDRAFTKLDRASCLAHDADPSAAVAYVVETLLGLSGQQRCGIIASRTREVVRALPQQARTLPQVADIHDLLTPTPETNKADRP